MLYPDIGDRIREARNRLGLNQEQLAEMARLNRVTIAKYESGKIEPGAQALMRISDALEMTVDELLGRTIEEQYRQDSGRPKTFEARIISGGVDKLPMDERERALDVFRAMYSNYPDLFDDDEKGDDDEA